MKMRVLLIVFVGILLGFTSQVELLAQDHEREHPDRDREGQEQRDIVRERMHREEVESMASREEHFANVEREIDELLRHGEHEKAAQLKQRLVEERHALHRPSREERGGQPNPDREIHELHRRLHHLNVAIENLRVAEFHEPAEALERQARELREELERRAHHPQPEHPAGHGERRDHPRPGPGPGPEMEELHRNLQEMRGQMEEFHRALRELHQRLDERDARR